MSGTVAIANGGTGSTTQNFVDLTTAQTVAGAKTFSSNITTPSVTSPMYVSSPQALNSGATISWNPANGLNASVTLDQNSTLSFSPVPTAGTYGTLVITQDATGGRTLTLPSTANVVLGSSSTTTIGLSSASGAKDILNFYYDGTNCYWNIGQGYGTVATVAPTNLASGVTGTVAIANGGTGSTTQNFVDLTTAQTVAGAKTFSSNVTGASFIKSGGTSSQFLKADGSVDTNNYLTTLSGGSNFVDLTTDQTVAGNKTFSSDLTINSTKYGRGAGNNTNSRNIAIGNASLVNNSSGAWNTAIGTYALQKNTTSGSNTAIGNEAISESVPGSNNTGIGSRALMYTSGTGNTSIGTNALINSTSGNNNTAIGINAFSTNSAGSNNTAIGASTVVSFPGLTNSTAIGYGATVSLDNTIQLGNTAVTNVNTSGSITANAAVSSEITTNLTINNANSELYKGLVLICNPSSPITITFNSDLPVGFNCMVLQKSADANKINLAAGSGAVLKNRNNYTATAGNYAIATIVNIGGGIIVTAGDMQ